MTPSKHIAWLKREYALGWRLGEQLRELRPQPRIQRAETPKPPKPNPSYQPKHRVLTAVQVEAMVVRPKTKAPKPLKPIKHRPQTAHLRDAAITGYDWLANDPCAYCGGTARQWDHIEPLYRGGAHDPDNLTRACWDCNRTKNTKPLLLFLARRQQRRTLARLMDP